MKEVQHRSWGEDALKIEVTGDRKIDILFYSAAVFESLFKYPPPAPPPRKHNSLKKGFSKRHTIAKAILWQENFQTQEYFVDFYM
jgi:hypothetical protein